MCFVFIWEQTVTCATYSINWLVFITEIKSVYSAVWTGSLNKAVCASSLKGLKHNLNSWHLEKWLSNSSLRATGETKYCPISRKYFEVSSGCLRVNEKYSSHGILDSNQETFRVNLQSGESHNMHYKYILRTGQYYEFACSDFRRVRKINKKGFVMFVRVSAWNNWTSIGQILVKFDICAFFWNLSWHASFHYNLTRITGTLHEDRYTFLTISNSVILRMRNISDKIYIEIQNTHIVFSNFFF